MFGEILVFLSNLILVFSECQLCDFGSWLGQLQFMVHGSRSSGFGGRVLGDNGCHSCVFLCSFVCRCKLSVAVHSSVHSWSHIAVYYRS